MATANWNVEASGELVKVVFIAVPCSWCSCAVPFSTQVSASVPQLLRAPLDSMVHNQGVLVPPPAHKLCAHSRQDRAPLWTPSGLRWLPAAVSTLLLSNQFWGLLWFHLKEVSQAWLPNYHWIESKGQCKSKCKSWVFLSQPQTLSCYHGREAGL